MKKSGQVHSNTVSSAAKVNLAGPVRPIAAATVLDTFQPDFASKPTRRRFAANLLPISADAAKGEIKSPDELALPVKLLRRMRCFSRIHLRHPNTLLHHQRQRFG